MRHEQIQRRPARRALAEVDEEYYDPAVRAARRARESAAAAARESESEESEDV